MASMLYMLGQVLYMLGQVLSAKWPCQWPSPRSASQQDKASPRSASEQDKHILMYLCVNVFTMCSCDVVYLRMHISMTV